MNKNLGLLLGGQFVSQIGDKFHMLAVAYLALETTGSPARMGLVLFSSIFPSMILGVISGAFLDRYNRKTIIIGADTARGLIVGAVCMLYYFDALTLTALITAQILISVCTAFFDPAVPAMIPQLVEEGQLTRANSQTQFVRGISTIIGPVLGGFAVALGGYLWVFLINAVSYLVSAVFECFITLKRIDRKQFAHTDIVDDILEGCRYVYLKRNLMVILIMVAVIHFFVGSIEAVIPVFALSLMGNGPENIGYIQTVFGLGMVVTAMWISIRDISEKEVKFLFGSVFFIGLMMLLIAAGHMSGIRKVMPFLVFFLAIGGFIIIAGTSFRSILQKDVEDVMMGRVFGFVSSVGNISLPLATLVYGIMLEYVPQNITLAATGTALLPTTYLFYRRYAQSVSR